LPTLHYNDIAIPGLANDLERVVVAGRLGLLQRTHPLLTFLVAAAVLLLLLSLLTVTLLRWRRQRRKSQPAT
jgi:ABC-type arginine transport system permease subunit